ncbi:MAG: mechanosensitive ion channel family protein [Chitinispirillaceae bacterium]|jgi:small-conductance mechanosensitive channel|nr:mechanosensitive ion channel family protein [Chitinispirillaceae bacterium]
MTSFILPEVLGRSLFGNTLGVYLTSAVILSGGCLVVLLVQRFGFRYLKRAAENTATDFDDRVIKIVESTGLPLLYLLAAYFAVQPLVLGKAATRILMVSGTILATFFAVRTILSLLYLVIEQWWRRKAGDEGSKVVKGIFTALQTVVWGVAGVLLLDNLGVKISALVAGLGIGGIAVALASQAVLGDLFSFITIFLDRPFAIGDFIIVDDFMGTVEHIGIKTTRLQSLGGEQIVFSNSDLTKSRLRNYKKMQRRRVLFAFGITYGTTAAHVKKIPAMVKEIVTAIPDTVFDRAHFKNFGDFSLDFEVVYYVIGSDYNKYMDIQQDINVGIKEEFEKEGIEFAFPTRTVYVAHTDS